MLPVKLFCSFTNMIPQFDFDCNTEISQFSKEIVMACSSIN